MSFVECFIMGFFKGFLSTRTTLNRTTYYKVNIELINELLSEVYTSDEVSNKG